MTFLTFETLMLYSLLAGYPNGDNKVADDKKAEVRRTEDSRRSEEARRADSMKAAKDGGSGKTPMDQSNLEADIKMTQAIRQAIVGDERLSFNAKNVKIVTQGGHVTLLGAVNSIAERNRVRELAAMVAGVTKVDDELEVPVNKPANTN